MLKTILNDLVKSFVKTDCKTVVCHSSDNGNLRISTTTDDKQMYIYTESVEGGWNTKEFAFRDWSAISSIISSFYDSENPDKCVMTLDKDSEDYPNVLNVKNGRMKMTHYLQNYTFISRQDDLLNAYKGKKFHLKAPTVGYIDTFDIDTMRSVSKLSSLTGEKLFRIGMEGTGLYFYFGDETKTIDNAKICVCENYEHSYVDKGLKFSVDYLNIAFNSLRTHNDVKMKIDGGTIVVSGSNDISNKVVAVIGKKEV